jgi:hypothetical protein
MGEATVTALMDDVEAMETNNDPQGPDPQGPAVPGGMMPNLTGREGNPGLEDPLAIFRTAGAAVGPASPVTQPAQPHKTQGSGFQKIMD